MIESYLFNNVPLHDLKSGKIVTVAGERDIWLRGPQHTNSVAFIFPDKVVAGIDIVIPEGQTLEDVLDVHNAVHAVFAGGGGVQPVLAEFVVFYSHIQQVVTAGTAPPAGMAVKV